MMVDSIRMDPRSAFVAGDSRGGMGGLVRIDADQDHRSRFLASKWDGGIRGRQVDFKNLSQHLVVMPLLSHAANEGWEGRHIPGKSTRKGDKRFRSQPSQPSPARYGQQIPNCTGAFKTSRLFIYLSSGAQVHTPAELHGLLAEAGFGAPRRIPILRIPGQAMYVVTRR